MITNCPKCGYDTAPVTMGRFFSINPAKRTVGMSTVEVMRCKGCGYQFATKTATEQMDLIEGEE